MHQPPPDHDPDEPAAGPPEFPHDGDPEDLEDLELGTPVYEGTGLSVRALTAEQLERFLQAHAGEPGRLLGCGWGGAAAPPPATTGAALWGSPDPTGPAALGWQPPALAGHRLAPLGGYGNPGRSALLQYRHKRAAELAGWARSASWRATVVVAAGLLASLLVQAVGLGRLTLPAGLAAGALAGWRLRFRVSQATRAWRDGARGERATARLLRRLHRRGYAVFHDVAIPGTPANHVVIGPAGVLLVDSKRYAGQVTQTVDGRVWHNHYPMDQQLGALRLEAEAISAALGVPVRPVMCVHGAQVAYGGLQAGGWRSCRPGACRACSAAASSCRRRRWPRWSRTPWWCCTRPAESLDQVAARQVVPARSTGRTLDGSAGSCRDELQAQRVAAGQEDGHAVAGRPPLGQEQVLVARLQQQLQAVVPEAVGGLRVLAARLPDAGRTQAEAALAVDHRAGVGRQLRHDLPRP